MNLRFSSLTICRKNKCKGQIFTPILNTSADSSSLNKCSRGVEAEFHRYSLQVDTESLTPFYLIDAGRHLLYKQALFLSFADKAGEEGEAVVVGPGGARG